MRYRSKPTTCNAIQWLGPEHNLPGVTREECYATIGGRGHGSQTFRQPDAFYVVTAHGQKAYLTPGDFVVAEPDGRGFYPVKPDIFETRWEPDV